MSEPIDIAVDLGAVPPALPRMVSLREFASAPHPAPPQIIQGVLHQGGKMILSGTSKSNKSWSLLDLALSVASGQPWWGRPCQKAPVAYLNFELQPWAIEQRVGAICTARPEKPHCGNCGVPFMYSATGWLVTCSLMTCCTSMDGPRKAGLKRVNWRDN